VGGRMFFVFDERLLLTSVENVVTVCTK